MNVVNIITTLMHLEESNFPKLKAYYHVFSSHCQELVNIEDSKLLVVKIRDISKSWPVDGGHLCNWLDWFCCGQLQDRTSSRLYRLLLLSNTSNSVFKMKKCPLIFSSNLSWTYNASSRKLTFAEHWTSIYLQQHAPFAPLSFLFLLTGGDFHEKVLWETSIMSFGNSLTDLLVPFSCSVTFPKRQ